MRLSDQEKKQLVVYDTRKEQPSIWNLQAFAIVFLFIMLATTINVYSVNNDNLTWVDSNGDFKLDSYDHSMINLDTDLIELNNQSLNDVFLDGNLQSLSNFNANDNAFTIQYDEYYEITSNGSGTYYTWRDSSFNYDTASYYFSSRVSSDDNITLALGFRFSDGLKSYTLNNLNNHDIQRFSGITSGIASTFYMRYLSQDLNTSFRVYDIYFINLADLGIDNLTQVQMDAYYNLYISLQENRIESYKDLGNEPISQWQNLTQYLQVTIDAIMGPINNINDWINKFMNGLFS